MIKELKYIKKEICEIQIPVPFYQNRYNPRYYSAIINNCRFSSKPNFINYERFHKCFFVFIFIGSDFPILSHKKKLLILHKYKFSKVYILNKNKLICYYFKRGVLFETEYVNDEHENILPIKRYIKLLKLNIDITL